MDIPRAISSPPEVTATRSPEPNEPETPVIPTGSRERCFFNAFAAPESTEIPPWGLADLSQRLFLGIAESDMNIVPSSFPETASTMVFSSNPEVIIILQPASAHMRAASSLVFIPPTPTLVVGSPAMCLTASMSLTVLIISASSKSLGFLLYRPLTSDIITSRSESELLAITADSVSLSPNTASISFVHTASFSLKIGTAPRDKRVLIVLLMLLDVSLTE